MTVDRRDAAAVAERQIRRREQTVPSGWPSGMHPVLRRVLAARGIHAPEDAELPLRALFPPDALGGMSTAVDLLCAAIEGQWRICVVGDFDCDGATGTAVAVRGLRLLGARQLQFKVPHRIRHGYGLSPTLVAELAQLDPPPQLIVTVDNGVAAIAGVAAAKAAGMRVLVTDHHLPGSELPAADAMVNPNLAADPFPSKALAGVGVMFYLLLAVRAELRQRGAFAQDPDLGSLLDLVAMGTVADLVPLDRNNRILVAAGLARIRRGHCCAGIRVLAEVAGRKLDAIHSTDLGFAIGPRINAAGRLEDMSVGIECLLADDETRARELAARLNAINADRRDLQEHMVAEAEQAVAMVDTGGNQLAVGVCLYEPAWHPGVVGLVASRLKERLHRPVIAFAPASDDPDESLLRGSARSISGFHVRDALAAVDACHPGMIERFGGHAMAAGLSLPLANLAAFAAAFDHQARKDLDADRLQAELWTDGELAANDFCRDLAEQLRAAGPWGQGFPEPSFDGEFRVSEWRVVGQRHLKLSLRTLDGVGRIDAIEFGGWHGEPPGDRVRLVYQLEPDDFRDRGGVQLLVRHRVDL